MQVWNFVRHDVLSKKLTAKYEKKAYSHVSFAICFISHFMGLILILINFN